jgi:hypothetical protein
MVIVLAETFQQLIDFWIILGQTTAESPKTKKHGINKLNAMNRQVEAYSTLMFLNDRNSFLVTQEFPQTI